MKIAVIASGDYFSTYGGGQVYVRNLVRGLRERGHDISVLSISVDAAVRDAGKQIAEADGASVWRITLPKKVFHAAMPEELQPFFLENLKKYLAEISPDIVHANGWKYAAALACGQVGTPCVVTAHHGGIVCPNGMLMTRSDAICEVQASMQNCLDCALHFVPGGPFWRPLVRNLPENIALPLAGALNKIRNIPYVSPSFQTPLGVANKLKQIDALKRVPGRIVAPSRAVGEALKRNGIPAGKVEVIPHGIAPLPHQPLQPGLHERAIRLGYVGRISYVKGLHVLIDALKLLPEGCRYELHVFGDAATKSEQKYLRNLRARSERMPIRWHGKVAYGDIVKAYHAVDAVILPSIYLEAFGLTVVEALSAGRPVIASRCGGPEDTVCEGVEGVLFRPNDPHALADALAELIREPRKVLEMSEAIRPVVSLEAHVEALEGLYAATRAGEQNV